VQQITFEMIIAALTATAAFSLLVERLVEALKNIIQSGGTGTVDMESTIKRIKTAVGLIQDISANLSGKQRNPQEIADAIEQALAKNSAGETSTPEPMREEMGDEDTFEVHSSIAIKKLTPMSEEDLDWCRLALFYQLSALALGIMIASVMNIHLLSMLLLKTDLFVPLDELNDGQKIYLFFDEILTGLVIAGGSQPIHVLLRFLSTRKPPPELAAAIEDDSEEVKLVATQSVSTVTTSVSPAPASLASSFSFTAKRAFPAMAPVASVDTGGWIPIEYHGGVKPESLQNRNHRPQDPNLIVFHHTAMSSSLGFQAVVDEFLVNKGWSTGYHCVIMPNGDIRPFCRWDRVGNHTKGLNARSLGVAFHGNFHLDSSDSYSNLDGRFGIQQPTSEQLQAGARLVALWVHLYEDIKLDFDKYILPHKKAKPGHTVCPGSNFPIEAFQSLVADYYQKWSQSAYAREQIAEFKLRPYLYKEGVVL
jgi:hypothetical protein